MKSLFAMWNGHQESVKKSGRVSEAWAAKRKRLVSKARLSKPYTRMCPAWLTWNDERKAFVVLPERAKIVQQIFVKADAGTGIERIARELNLKNVPTWSEGKLKAAFGEPLTSERYLQIKLSLGPSHLTLHEPTTIRAHAETNRLSQSSIIFLPLWTR